MTAMIGLPTTKGAGVRRAWVWGRHVGFLHQKPGHPTVDIASDDELFAPGQERAARVLFVLHTLWGKRQLTAVA